MKDWIHEKLAATFWITLSLYTVVPASVTPLAEVTTYAAGPVLLVTGVLAWFTAPREER